MEKKLSILLVLLTLCLLAITSLSPAEDIEDTIACKLAVINTRAVDPEAIFLGPELEPERAVVTEFQWILDSLKHRCTNSREEIASILMDAWELVKRRGYAMTLLETSRALSAHTRSKVLLGYRKVDFRATAGLWTSTYKPYKPKEE